MIRALSLLVCGSVTQHPHFFSRQQGDWNRKAQCESTSKSVAEAEAEAEAARTQLVSSSCILIKSNENSNSNSNNISNNKQSFYISYDMRTRNPLYVVERLNSNSQSTTTTSSNKRPPFSPEYLIPFDAFRMHPKDYNDSNYDRGHMVPAADFAGDSAYERTFTMANISPQAPLLNQGFWSRFESWIRQYLLKHVFDEAIVITGPVFAPTFIDNRWVHVNRTVGFFPNLIQVPTHFFKVVLGKKNGSSVSVVAAFMVPNTNTVSKTDSVMSYMVKLGQLESLVGFRFFPAIIDDKERNKLDLVVPDERDLSVVLNSANLTNHAAKKLVDWRDIGDSKNSLVIRSSETKISTKKKSATQGVVHLCEFGVDCSRCMFKQ